MKIKEVKAKSSKSQLNELQLSSLLGDYGAAQQQQAFGFGGGRTKQDIMTQNIFIKNFVSNAISNLQTAIKGGVVDPKKTTPRKATAKDFDSTYKTMQPGDIGDWNLKDKMAQQAQVRKDQEIANVANARMAAAAASPTSPEASAAVDARMQRAAQAKQAQTPGPSSVDDKVDKSAAQRGPQTSAIPQNTDPRNRFTAQQKKEPKKKFAGPTGIDESQYQYLNLVFEAIMETVLPDQYEDGNVMTVDQYLKDVWFPNYMKGVDTTSNQQKINQIMQQVADTYPKDGGRAALTQLANLSYSISPRKEKKQPEKSKAVEPAVKQNAPAVAKPEVPVVSVGKDKYTKSERGWMNDKKELVSAAMAQTLDQIYDKQKESPATTPAPATEPAKAAVKATDADFAPVEPEKQIKLPFGGPGTNISVLPKKTGTYQEAKITKRKLK